MALIPTQSEVQQAKARLERDRRWAKEREALLRLVRLARASAVAPGEAHLTVVTEQLSRALQVELWQDCPRCGEHLCPPAAAICVYCAGAEIGHLEEKHATNGALADHLYGHMVAEPTKPACSRCADTHQMPAWNGSGAMWPCTFCPRPCELCRERPEGGPPGAYCAVRLCPCDCHKPEDERAVCTDAWVLVIAGMSQGRVGKVVSTSAIVTETGARLWNVDFPGQRNREVREDWLRRVTNRDLLPEWARK